MERWLSGLRRSFGVRVCGSHRTEGSNPSLSADVIYRRKKAMLPEKIIIVAERYREELIGKGHTKKRFSEEVFEKNIPTTTDAKSHCLYMLDEIITFVKAGRIEKANRWLGFVQGALWLSGEYTIIELKKHNKPEADA